MTNLNEEVQHLQNDHPSHVESPDSGIGLVELLTWLGESKRLIAAVTLATGVAAAAYSLALPNVYTARTTLLPANTQQQSGSAAALAALGSLGGLTGGLAAKTPDDLFVRLLTSDSVLRPLIAKFELSKRYQIEKFEQLRKVLPMFIRITSDKKSGVIMVEVDDEDPKFAAELANAHATEVSRLLSRLAVSEAQQRRVFFEQQLKETKDNLIQAEQSLRKVQEKSGMVAMEQQAEAIIKGAAELKARIIEREVRLKVLRTATTPENPDVRLMSAELNALRAELARMESSNASPSATKGIGDIPVSQLPAAAIDFVRASREVKFQESMLSSMLRQFEIAKLDEAKDSPALQQIDVAVPPDFKSKPGRVLIVLAASLAAFLLTSIWVLLRQHLRSERNKSPDRAEALSSLRRAWKFRRG